MNQNKPSVLLNIVHALTVYTSHYSCKTSRSIVGHMFRVTYAKNILQTPASINIRLHMIGFQRPVSRIGDGGLHAQGLAAQMVSQALKHVGEFASILH